MTKYYTKCGKEFNKSTKAGTTGYHLSEDEKGNIKNEVCSSCPFIVDVKEGWPAVHKRYECRAGSQPPNPENTWLGSKEDKCSLQVLSINHDFCEKIIAYCKDHPDLSAAYGQDCDDCRKVVSVTCSQNKKGVQAKKDLIAKFFPEPGNVEPELKDDIEIIETKEEEVMSSTAEVIKSFPVIVGGQQKDVVSFDYAQYDEEIANTLRFAASQIKKTFMETIYEIGKYLSMGNDALAKAGHGTFGNWCMSMGYSRQTAYNYINAYKFICRNFDNPEQALGIQQSLLFSAAKPDTPGELVEAVISGDITKHKDFVEAKRKLAEVESTNENLVNEKLAVEKELEELRAAREEAAAAVSEQELARLKAEEEARAKEYEEKLLVAQKELEELKASREEAATAVSEQELARLKAEEEARVKEYEEKLLAAERELEELKASREEEVNRLGETWSESIEQALFALNNLEDTDMDYLLQLMAKNNDSYIKVRFRLTVTEAIAKMGNLLDRIKKLAEEE